MNHPVDPRIWWDWHLRKARGETLSEQEQQLYDAEVARQDREALRVMEAWMVDPRFAQVTSYLQKIKSRLETFVSSKPLHE